MDKKLLIGGGVLALGLLWLNSRKAQTGQTAQAARAPGAGQQPAVIPVKPLDLAIVAAQQGSSGQILDDSGAVQVSAPVAIAAATGGSVSQAAQGYLGHEVVGYTEAQYEAFAAQVQGMSMHEVLELGRTTGIPGGVVPLEVTTYLEYKTEGYSPNFQQLLTPELIARLDAVWRAEEVIAPPAQQVATAVSVSPPPAPAPTPAPAIAVDPYPYKSTIDGAQFATAAQLQAHLDQFFSSPAPVYQPPPDVTDTYQPDPVGTMSGLTPEDLYYMMGYAGY